MTPWRTLRRAPRRPFWRRRGGGLGGRIGSLALAAAALSGCGAPTSGRSATELYGEHCVRCHGADGHGDPRALALAPNSDLSRSPLVRARARGPIFRRITQGYGSMPGFGHKLERGDVEMLVDYVLELEAPSPAR